MADIISLELVVLNECCNTGTLNQIKINYFSACRAGYKKVGDECILCPEDTFRKYIDPETECRICPSGTGSMHNHRVACCMYQNSNNYFWG